MLLILSLHIFYTLLFVQTHTHKENYLLTYWERKKSSNSSERNRLDFPFLTAVPAYSTLPFPVPMQLPHEAES